MHDFDKQLHKKEAFNAINFGNSKAFLLQIGIQI
jgi:hypothetical protein